MSYSCRVHGWKHLFNPCPSCPIFINTELSEDFQPGGIVWAGPQDHENEWDQVMEFLKKKKALIASLQKELKEKTEELKKNERK